MHNEFHLGHVRCYFSVGVENRRSIHGVDFSRIALFAVSVGMCDLFSYVMFVAFLNAISECHHHAVAMSWRQYI
jgi:hypothetical protein